MMPRNFLKHECLEYVKVQYVKEISFPQGMVFCDLCTFCHSENSGTRFRCSETGEILPFHNCTTGLRCPLDLPNNHTEIEEE